MNFEFSTLILGGVAGLSLASAAACAVQCFSLQKRVKTMEGRQGETSSNGDPSADYTALAGRLSAITASVGVLQSSIAQVQNGLSELEATVAQGSSRTEESNRLVDLDRRKPRFQTEIQTAPINLNRRGQMMRMHRRGESIPAIASALGISQGEVKLTVRMQELCSEMPEKENSHDRL